MNAKIISSPFKLSTILSLEDFVPDFIKSRVVYQFTCASCGARYIGETHVLKETSTLKANGRLIVENTALIQISVESPAIRYQCQAKQGLAITYICF